MPAVPLPILLPAALATTAYLNARYALSYDAGLLTSFARCSLAALLAERRDQASLWYEFEARATDARTRDVVFLVLPTRTARKTGRKRKMGRDGTGEADKEGSVSKEEADAEKEEEEEEHLHVSHHTYASLYARVLRFAAWLRAAHGVRPGHVVAVDMMNSARFVVAWFALWALGAVPAFLNYNIAGDALLHCVRTSTAGLVLVGPEEGVRGRYEGVGGVGRALEGAQGGKVRVVVVDEAVEEEVERFEALRPGDGERGGAKLHDMGILIYTSGTTGLPKPAVVSWGKLRMGSFFVGRWLPLKKGDIMYTCMPLYHTSASMLGLLSTVSAGTTLALGHKFSVRHLLPDLIATGSTHLQYVGETLRYLLTLPPSSLDRQHSVHTIFGNGLRPDVWDKVTHRFNIATVAEFYAATEGPSGMFNKSRNAFSAGAVGRNGKIAELLLLGRMQQLVRIDPDAPDGNTVYRDKRTGLCVPARPNEPGELLYRLNPADISRRFQGYFNAPGASRKKILRDVFAAGDAWFSTGDVLRRDADGRWFFVDRLGDTFRWKSENVSTAEVAGVVGACAGVREACVYGVMVPGHEGRAGCAAVVLDVPPSASSSPSSTTSPSADPSPSPSPSPLSSAPHLQPVLSALAAHVTAHLPPYAAPLFLRLTPRLTVTSTNKHQKTALRDDGVDPARVERSGDVLFWLRNGRYERFGVREWAVLGGGGVRL